MISKTNQVISVAMSAALLLTNMIAPMKVYAEETSEETILEAQPEYPIEEEPPAPVYTLTLPWYEDIVYMVDEGRVFIPENISPEDKTIYLRYELGEKVEYAFTPYNGASVTELHLKDNKGEENYFETDEYGKISFLMPEKDLWFSLAYEIITPPETSEQETTAAELETPAPESEPETLPVLEPVTEPSPVPETQTETTAQQPVTESQPESEEDFSPDPEEMPAAPSEEPDIELRAETEEDGLPQNGSILTAESVSIPLGSVFVAAADYTNIDFDEESETIELISDETDVNTPGTYSTIYRVTHGQEKMWYVLRPVIVLEGGTAREGESESAAGASVEKAEDSDDPDPDTETPLETEEETTEAGDSIQAETEELPEEISEELTEEVLEEESETEDGFKVYIQKGEEIGVALDHEDGTYEAGETVTFTTDLSPGTLTAAAALKEESNKTIDTADILYSEISYHPGADTFSFEMPMENILLEVSKDTAAGAVLKAGTDGDEWDDNTDVEAGSYYYFSDGTLHPFNTVMGSGGNDSYKYVRYKVDGVTYTVNAYCMQHSMTSPPSGTTYTSMIELDEGGDDRYLRKALFYGYGGPGWGGTFNGYNVRQIMVNYGCSSETRAMQHYLVDFLYDGEAGFGGNLSETAKNMLREIKMALYYMPDPTASQLLPSLSEAAAGNKTPTFTWKADPAFVITIHLEDGVKLVNETTGKTGTGNVAVKGGEKFHLEAEGDTGKLTGTYEITSNYPLDFHAMLLKLTNSQDIGFGYYTGSKGLALNIDWPDAGYVSVQKKASDGKTYDFSGCRIGVYSDSAATKLVHEFVTKKDGSADAALVSPGTYYAKEISVPSGWNLNNSAVKVTVTGANSSASSAATAVITNSRAAKPVEIQKIDADTGKTAPYNDRYSFDKAAVTIYSDEGCSKKVTEVTTNASGYAKTDPLEYGTYYAKETKAPSGYTVNDHVFTVVVSDTVRVDGSSSKIEIKEKAVKKPIEVRKTDKDTGKSEPFNANYSFTGMQVTIYSDKELKNAAAVLTANNSGYAKSVDLYYGTYYVKETKAPKGYRANEHIFEVVIGTEVTVDGKKADSATFTIADEIIRKPIALQKYDKEKGTAGANNKAVSFKGAAYSIYEDAALTKEIAVLTSDEAGKALSVPYPYGTYYVKETKAPKGYLPDTLTYKVVIGDTVTVNGAPMDAAGHEKAIVSSYEQVIRGDVSVMKYLDESADGSILQEWLDKEMLKGIEFTLTHEDPAITPVKIVTDRYGHAETEGKKLVFGRWQISETAGTPEGYQGLDKAFFTIEENEAKLSYVVTNKKPQLQVRLHKKDALTGELIPVRGAKFQVLDKDGNSIRMPDNLDYAKVTDTFTTNEEGVIAFSARFEPGTYVIREVEAPEGFLLSEDVPVTLTVDDDVTVPVIAEAADMPQKGRIKVIKTDAGTGESLGEGFSFDIFAAEDITDASGKVREEEIDGEVLALKAGTKVDSITSDESGTALSRELFLGSYYVSETASAEYYAVDDEKKEVTIAFDREVETVVSELPFTNVKTKFDLIKTDADTKEPLSGITFRIFSTADEEAEKARQVAEAVEALRAGQELLKQDLFEKQQMALENLGDVTEERRAEFIAAQEEELAAFEAGLEKERIALEEKLMAELEITDTSALGKDYVTDEEGRIHLEDLLHENTYYVYEIATKPGYNLDPTIHTFSVDEKGLITGEKSHEIKLTNQPNVVEISKRDITGGEELPGASLTLFDADGNELESWVSGKEPHVIKRLPAGIYRLREITAPEGYAIAEDITFELTDSLTVQQVTMIDERLQVHFSKKDITGKEELPGASLKVTDLEGNVIDEWVSDKEPHIVNLKAGKYVLTETAPPERYATAESVEFEIRPDLSVTKVEMRDAPIQVEISKKELTTGDELPGARLQVLDTDGKVMEEWTSADKPHMLSLRAGTYTLIEDLAPIGYATASAISFEVKDSAEIQKVEMFDDVTKVKISKQDIVGEKELPGARLVIKDRDGKTIEEWVSTEEPHYIEKLPVGTYTLTEITAPEGYGTAETVTFEVKNTTEIQAVTMKDAPLRKVEISKTDVTNGKELPGAHVSVLNEEGKVIDEWISTEKPHMMSLDQGKYTLREEKAPDGYVTAKEVIFEVTLAKDRDDLEVTKVEMKDDVTKVEISKQDITTEKELPGAKLIIRDKDKKEVESWTSTDKPHMIERLPVGKYTLTEVTAPKGYDIAETIEFEVTDSPEIVHVRMMDKPKDELVDLTGKTKEVPSGGGGSYSPGPGISTGGGSFIASAVKTGDFNRYLPAVLLILAGAGGLLCLTVSKKRKRNTD